MQFVDTVTPSGFNYQDRVNTLTELGSDSPFAHLDLFGKRAEQTARDYLTMYYQNAWNAAMLNYQNEYNSPLQQMLRYQEAGLSPWQVTDSGNMSSSPAAAAPKGSAAVSDSPASGLSAVFQGVSSISTALKTAQQIYDYLKYGRDISANEKMASKFRADSAQYKAMSDEAEMAWSRYWNLGEQEAREGSQVQLSPRASYMEASTQQKQAQIKQLDALVDTIYPTQAAANSARAALAAFQKEVMEGQKGAILEIDTGYPTLDAVLKMVAFWILGR